MGTVRPLRLLPLALLAAACGKGSFNNAGGSAGDTFVYPLQAKNTTLDPGKVNDIYVSELLQNVVEPLVMYDEKNEVVPCLAEKWDLTDGGKTYVFHLRKGVKYADGKTLKAADFKAVWERSLLPKFGSPAAANYLSNIVGVADMVSGKATELTGVKAIDDETLSVTIDQPRPYFLGNLATLAAAVYEPGAAGPNEITTIEKLVGTGPFKLSKLAPDAEIDLDANENYWGGRPRVAHIKRPIVTDPSARLSRFLSGEFDYIELARQDAQNLDKAKAEKGGLRFVPRASLDFLILGEGAYPPFRDVRVRQAFAMAIDRKHLVADLLAGYDEAKGLVPHGVPGYQADYAGLAFDPAKAKSLLAAAGYPEGKGLPAVELDYTSINAENRVIAESVATDLSKNLGVKVQPQLLEWGAYLDRQDHGKVPIGSVGWTADYLDQQNFVSMQVASFGPQDKEGFRDAQVDALCAKADIETRPAVRNDLYKQAERRAIEQAARIPIYMSNVPIMTSPRLKGLRMNAIGLMPHTQVELTK